MTETTELERCAQAIMESVPPVMHFIRAEMRRGGSAALSVPQFRSLSYLRRHPGASLSDLAEHLGITAPSASTMVERLVQSGYVDRVPDPAERRRALITLTPAGAELYQSAREATRERVVELLAGLTPEQVEGLSGAMTLLQSLIREVSTGERDRL